MKLLECIVTQGGGHSGSSFDLGPINIDCHEREWPPSHTTTLLSSLSSQLQLRPSFLLITPAKALRTFTMASEQPTHFTAPPVFVHPPSPGPAEPTDITNDIAEEARTFKSYLHHFDCIDPQFGFRPELAYAHLPPIPSRARYEPPSSFDSSTLQVASGFIPSSEPWRILDSAAFPLYSSGVPDSDSDRNWDPVAIIAEVLSDQHFYENSGVDNTLCNGQGQGERGN